MKLIFLSVLAVAGCAMQGCSVVNPSYGKTYKQGYAEGYYKAMSIAIQKPAPTPTPGYSKGWDDGFEKATKELRGDIPDSESQNSVIRSKDWEEIVDEAKSIGKRNP